MVHNWYILIGFASTSFVCTRIAKTMIGVVSVLDAMILLRDKSAEL